MLIALILIIIHYIGDFLFQTEWMAINKSKSITILISHTFIYTITFYTVFILYIIIYDTFINNIEITIKWFAFFPITFIFHTIIDYISSKITSKKFKNKEYYTGIPNMGAFSIIGLDQVFHYITLFLTYQFVIN
jgi:hypothetical protein